MRTFKLILAILLFTVTTEINAQQFIDAGRIEFQVVTNNHKRMGDRGFWSDMWKDKTPRLSTSYYTYSFADNKAVYKFDRNEGEVNRMFDRQSDDDVWFMDYVTNKFTDYKFVVDNNYLLSGELMKIDWKVTPGETRVIANFNCRKATGVIFDSVYVFAFYTDEITVTGGPMGINGLPGMILGVTIPRMFTSWVATKIETIGIDKGKVIAPTKGKKKTAEDLTKTVKEAIKDWGEWGQQIMWRMGI